MPGTGAVAPTIVARAPKALLHDHLDGGLRPATVVELAEAAGYTDLPTTDAVELGRWFRDAADSGSLVRYLETFSHTVAVMQTREQLTRVARECALDLAADGVVYAESRFAPELHIEGGLTAGAGRRGRARRVPRGRGGSGRRRHAHPDADPAHRDAARRPQQRDRRARRDLP